MNGMHLTLTQIRYVLNETKTHTFALHIFNSRTSIFFSFELKSAKLKKTVPDLELHCSTYFNDCFILGAL